MKLYIIRHAEPDYAADSLTEKGWREAELLSHRLAKIPAAAYYVSPMGRAKDTASFTLQAVGRQAQQLDWLREFSGKAVNRDGSVRGCCWDFLPRQWLGRGCRRYFDPDRWIGPLLWGKGEHRGSVRREYRWVLAGLDALLEKHGYRREGRCYRAVEANEDTVMLFCHYGVECVILSHLLNLSPMQLWHGLVPLPSSVTVVATEEREKGTASWRVQRFGDLSHLDAAGEEPSFMARFCEVYDRMDQRH